MRLYTALIVLVLSRFAVGAPPASEWVHPDAAGKLVYKTTDRGDRILDFSYAGYRSGGVALPDVPVVKTLSPTGGADDSPAIQVALDEIGNRPIKNGFRGALLLKPGVFNCASAITIKSTGVVLRGSGSGSDSGTILKLSGAAHVGISMGGNVPIRPTGQSVAITDAYVPAGSISFHVSDIAGFAAGDAVVINHPATPQWVEFMGMDNLVRNGKKENWVSGPILAERKIKAVAGNQITLDVPLADSYDAKYLSPPGASMSHAMSDRRISEVGVERLRIISPPQAVGITDKHYSGIHLGAVEDAWVRDVALVDMVGSISVASAARRVTAEDVTLSHTVPTVGAAKPADLSADGSQILFRNCKGDGANLFYFVTGARVTGPIVLLDCTFTGTGWIQPHQRWATGLLCDNCQVPNGGIEFMNRGQMGSGHGWTIGWSVAWNCQAKSLTFQNPPGAINWAIGCVGERKLEAMPFTKEPKIPEGTMESNSTTVGPKSLYRAQLRERLGSAAVQNVDTER
ncbi:MAG TPA: hypothetical protein VIM11_20665 [Tepidisphaeraceae bacterium]|jgi:hypothetical protein